MSGVHLHSNIPQPPTYPIQGPTRVFPRSFHPIILIHPNNPPQPLSARNIFWVKAENLKNLFGLASNALNIPQIKNICMNWINLNLDINELVNYPDLDQRTLLHYACARGEYDLVEFLCMLPGVDFGRMMRDATPEGSTPPTACSRE